MPRNEYPRPTIKRKDWLNLNGIWGFSFDDHNVGLNEQWYDQHELPETIKVPFGYQTKNSGIGNNEFHDIVWYKRSFTIPEDWQKKEILLHFQAVDYRSQVWVNGVKVTEHEGGHTPFSVNITYQLNQVNNTIVVRVEDFSEDLEQPRGKQYWKEESSGIYYSRTTGIWQTVWLEPVSKTHIHQLKLTPNIDDSMVSVNYKITNPKIGQNLVVEVSYRGSIVCTERIPLKHEVDQQNLQLSDFQNGNGRLWSPESPNLYDVRAYLLEIENVIDEVQSYFGMRKIAIVNGKIELNNQPYYMKLVLDQGYYPDSLLTAPDEDWIKRDIRLTKEMGFNGVRKHQKVEEPTYLYWADRMGLLVWGEMANANQFGDTYRKRIINEWQEVIERDYNHPSIIVWVPINESWGVPQIHRNSRQANHAMSLYHLTKSMDTTRLVISNDGWEHVKSDILTIHDYEGKKEVLKDRYASVENILASKPADRLLYVKGYHYNDEPILVSEFGGIAFQKNDWQGWGYTTANDESDFLNRYRQVVTGLLESSHVQGFCYTQLTDIEQEINGLLTYDRKPKVELTCIRRINEGKA